ncbi:MAG: glycine--tRNA ligase [Parcubacteria group bacterium]|nr:glycine--tRNA ligase [Parcubacteria group bacterium]
MSSEPTKLDKIVSLAKRRGFAYRSSEIYGGFAGFWDFGPYGVALKRNIENLWWRMFAEERDDIYGMDAAIVMNPAVWRASGHAEGFADPLVECEKCKARFRADHVEGVACPDCGGALIRAGQFNMMFQTQVGAGKDSVTAYLRPETAQGMFANFKNVADSLHPKLPFGLAQIGKAFRNEIAPRDFFFRTREFSQMEVEYFVREKEWKKYFEKWRKHMWKWVDAVGLSREHVREIEVAPEDRAHYSKRTIDFEYDFPHGWKELCGLAYRGDFDLRQQMNASGVDLHYVDEDGAKFLPHVIEPSLGLERAIFAVLFDAYTEDELGGETRVYLKLKPALAPIKAAVFPLLRNKPELVKKARKIYKSLRKKIPTTAWDDNGNIGKRYRRQDEIGTPYCITIDFQTLEDNTVTVRDRDTGTQERVASGKLTGFLKHSTLG